jgi:transcription antitermination factor NusG
MALPSATPNVRDPGWYVLLAHPREERRAASRLIAHGLKVYLPELPVRRLAGRKMQERNEPMLPTYLFLRQSPQTPWWRVRVTPGIRFGMGGHCALMSGDRYAVVPAVAMEIIFAKESRLCARPDERPEAPAIGKIAEVIDGSFAWLRGVIEGIDRLDSHGRIDLALEILGRLVTVDLEVSQIRIV